MKKLLMLCGTIAAVIYAGTVILGALIRPGYSHISDAISELVADGAPNRFLISSLFLIYNLLLVAFGIGSFLEVKDRSRGRRSGFIGSLALMLVGLAGVSMELAFPQDPGGNPTTFAGTMHLVMAGIASLGTMVAIVFLALWFRNFSDLKGYVAFSWISVVIIFISGGLSAAAMANHHPLFGLIERVTIGTFILWLFVVGQKMIQLKNESAGPMHLKVLGSASKGK